MKDAETRTWYRLAVARTGKGASLVAAEGEHLGVAIAAAQKYIGDGSYVIACDVARGDDVPLGQSVGKQRVVEQGAATDVDVMRWPAGVLPQLGRTMQLADAKRGFTRVPHESLFVMEAQTNHEHVVDLFLGMIERLPTADNLEIRVLDHFDDAGRTDVWLTSRVNAKKILAFLDDFDTELLDNGHLELGVYIRDKRATLRLTEHKTVAWVADDDSMQSEVAAWFRALDVPRVDSLVRLSSVPHFHWRGAKTRARKKLGDELFKQRLRRVDKVALVTGPREPD
ncbi:MAG: hypothetical protein ACKV2T_18980 [Kofleriaceae bacterium]